MLRIDKYFQLCGVSGLCCNDLTQFCSVLFSPSFTEVYLIHKNLHIKKNLFCIGILLINNFVIVSCGQQRDSAIHMHVSILPQTPLPSRLPHNLEQSSLCYTIGPCWLHTCMLSRFSRVQLCEPMDQNTPGFSVHGILQGRIPEWVAMPSSRGSS